MTSSSTTDRRNLLRVSLSSGLVVVLLQTVTAVLGLRRGRRDFADAAWGPGLAAVAITSASVGSGPRWRRWTLAALVTAWATRLESVMLGRLRSSHEEDSRYTEFLDGDGTATVVGKVFVTQAVAQLLVSAPVQVSAASTTRGRRRWLFPLGVAVAVGGAVVEAVADRQKSAFKDQPKEQRPDILDTNLWGISRHPNYLGDSLVWDGVWIAGAASAPALITLPAPAAMSYFLMYATGAKRTEEHMEEREGYRDYQRRVPFFFPWPRPA